MFIWNAANNEYVENVDPGYMPRFIRHYDRGWRCCGENSYYNSATECLNAVMAQDAHDSVSDLYI